MEITKPVLHVGVLKHDLGNIVYDEDFLEKLAESHEVGIELNDHEGEDIGKIKKLEVKNKALYATLDVPDEDEGKDVAFSTDIVPQKYEKIDSMTFKPTEGFLKSVVYVNDQDKLDIVRDEKTITFLQNFKDEEEGEVNMAEDNQTAQELGALRTKYESLKAENQRLQTENEKLQNEKSTLETTVQEKENELTTVADNLKTYKETEEAQKEALIKEMVKDEDDPLGEVYKKMTMEDLRILKEKKPPSTPPKGVGTKVGEEEDGSTPNDDKEEGEFDYKVMKKGLGLR